MRKPVHYPEFTQVIHSLAPLLRRHPPLRRMSFDDLCDWMCWFWNRGTMSWRVNESGVGLGVCLIRLFRNMHEWMEPDAHDPCGKFVFIELLIADDPMTLGNLHNFLVQRWGKQETVMWDRGNRTEYGPPRMFRWDQFEKIARKLSYGQSENP